MMLLQLAADAVQAGAAGGTHPLSGTAARYLWLLPLLPLLGFVLNGLLSLVPAYHAGPADPDVGHGTGPEAGHAVAAAHAPGSHDAPSGGGHGDDHHAVVRHRFAT